MKKTEFLEHSLLRDSPNQPIIQYNEGYTRHIPPSNHVLVSTPINISKLNVWKCNKTRMG